MQAPILAECTRCGSVFAAGSAGGGGMSLGPPGSSMYAERISTGSDPNQIEIKGVKVSCPVCPGVGVVPDGVYQLLWDGYRVFRNISPSDARTLARALEQYAAGSVGVDEVEKAAPPEARSFLRRCLTERSRKLARALLIPLLIAAFQQWQSMESTHDIERRIEEVQTSWDAHLNELDREMCRQVAGLVERERH